MSTADLGPGGPVCTHLQQQAATAHPAQNKTASVLHEETDLGPGVLIAIIELEADEADRGQLNGAPPELAAHLCIPGKAPVLPLPVRCYDCRVVHHLLSRHRCPQSMCYTVKTHLPSACVTLSRHSCPQHVLHCQDTAGLSMSYTVKTQLPSACVTLSRHSCFQHILHCHDTSALSMCYTVKTHLPSACVTPLSKLASLCIRWLAHDGQNSH